MIKEIRMALLNNASLYENYDLSQFVVQILSQDTRISDLLHKHKRRYRRIS